MGRTAPWLSEPAPTYAGPFHKNIVEFLAARGTRVPLPESVGSTEAWVVPLEASDGPVNLHIYRESYDDDPTRAACDQCRIIGMRPDMPASSKTHFGALPPLQSTVCRRTGLRSRSDHVSQLTATALRLGAPPCMFIRAGDHKCCPC